MFNTERVFNPNEGENHEEVFLPDSIVELIESDERPDNPLKLACEKIERAGVDPIAINRYKHAVMSILNERGNIAKIDYKREFSSPEYYFSPQINFDSNRPDIALLSDDLKPRLSNTDTLEAVEFNEGMLGHIIGQSKDKKEDADETIPAESILHRKAPLDKAISPFRKFLTKINGLMYLIHDAQHITQGLVMGDKLNLVRESLGEDLPNFDPEKVKMLLKFYGSYVSPEMLSIGLFDKINEFPLVHDFDPDTGSPIQSDTEKINVLINNNEATMDVLADESMREYLRSMPAFMLYLHNSMTLLVESLEWARNELFNYVEKRQDGQCPIPEVLNILEEVSWQINFMSRPYFSAFNDSADAIEYFKDSKEFLGKKVCGKIVTTNRLIDPIYLEVVRREVDALTGIKNIITRPHRENILDEGEVLQPQDSIKTVKYPSGQIHIDAQEYAVHTPAMDENIIFYYPPVTKAGVEIGCNLISKALENGATKKALHELLALLAKVKIDDQASITNASNYIKNEFGIDISDDNIKEMYGLAGYMTITRIFNNQTYNLQFYIRKTLIKTLERNGQSDLVDILTGSCFFDPIVSETEHIKQLIGVPSHFNFLLKEAEIIPALIKRGDHRPTIWSIDLEKLNEGQKARFSKAYKDAAKSENMTSEERVENLRIFAQIKKEQISEQSFAE